MTRPTPEQYEAAALIERLAIGDEGEQRERSRALILRGGETARIAAEMARRAACDRVVAVSRAIETLGLDA
jgi:threonine dehydrogenase-like Zn-dependent dehydrogenase